MTEDQAYAECESIAREHYENFPVASLLVPRDKRRHVASIYAFARTADDYADEGDFPPAERLARLDAWEEALTECYAGRAENPIFIALSATVRETAIPRELLAALLSAFRMDVVKHRYATFTELLRYCVLSANPVGRLVLRIFGKSSTRTNQLSDNICTALQLANFWQDLSIDRARGRVYLPLEDFGRFGYTESEFHAGIADDRFRALVRFQVARTRGILRQGLPLIPLTGGRLRRELAATCRGGLAILDGIERGGCDTLRQPVRLTAVDRVGMMWGALRGKAS